jgi:AbrB family looped-hinge helix DNA binding protein
MTVKQAVATVTSKGQVTVPVEVRRHLRIDEGDKVVFRVDETGAVRLERVKYPTIASLRGIAGTLKKPRTWQEIEGIVHEERAGAIEKKLRG